MRMFSGALVAVWTVLVTVDCRLQPAENVFPMDINKAVLPTVRQTLNDCHLRYHKYGEYNLVYPIYGVPAKEGEFAHMAAIGWTQATGAVSFDCGGSLITTRHVLTAAHCASNSDGVAPDVVWVGVVNITDATGDRRNQFAQQRRITNFQRHPNHRYRTDYDDIALITLESPYTVNNRLVPACLWKEADVPFPRMEAVGFGQTSFGGEKTPILLKVSLSYVPNAECSQYHQPSRKLSQGLVASQMCAFDDKMDTCLGDSGGPLQAKMMSNNRLTPLVVGITSFGKFCGSSTPSVYTKVSEYVGWIEAETGESFDIKACTGRYLNKRQFEDAMIARRADQNVFIEPEKSYMDIENVAKHRVYLGYVTNSGNIQWNCGGVLINENYVLTVAHCDKFVLNKTPEYVKIGDVDIFRNQPEAQVIEIRRFITHPEYRAGIMDNDIALVELRQNVKLQPNAVPACILNSDDTKLPFFEMAGLGPYNRNNFMLDDAPISSNQSLTLTRMRADNVQCQGTRSGKVMCTRNAQFLIPGTCRIEHGGPLEREIWHFDRYFSYVFGLSTSGKDCGFGSESYYVKISSHIQWIESIVLNKRRAKRQIVFPDDESMEDNIGSPCTTAYQQAGRCQYYRSCSTNIAGTLVKFCRHGTNPIVCCPTRNIPVPVVPAASQGSRYSLNNCVSHWERHKQRDSEEYESIPSEGRSADRREYPHVAIIGGRDGGGTCTGILVSDLFVLTSASCLSGVRADSVLLGSQRANVIQTIQHPAYDPTLQHSDLALLRLGTKVSFSSEIIPACIWPNEAIIPLKLYVLGNQNGALVVRPRSAVYNDDCRTFFRLPNINDQKQICSENYYLSSNACDDRSGDAIEGVIMRGDLKISIVVGITSYSTPCMAQTVSISARLANHLDWIKQNVEV